MKPFVFARAARDDLDSIGNYLLGNVPLDAALRIVESIETQVSRLAGNPEIGHKRQDLGDESLRYWLVERRYLIIYRNTSEALEVVRIVHGARDIAALIGEDAQGTRG